MSLVENKTCFRKYDCLDFNLPLGEGFILADLTRLPLARRIGCSNVPKYSQRGEDIFANLVRLTSNILAPLKREFGSTLKIISGYQSPDVHMFLGMDLTSHAFGRGLDFRLTGVSDLTVIEFLRELPTPIDVVVIEEYHALINKSPWTHVSIPEEGNDPQGKLLRFSNGVYHPYYVHDF